MFLDIIVTIVLLLWSQQPLEYNNNTNDVNRVVISSSWQQVQAATFVPLSSRSSLSVPIIDASSSSRTTSRWIPSSPFTPSSSSASSNNSYQQKSTITPSTTNTIVNRSPSSSSNVILMNVPILNDWKVLTNGRVVGTVKNHPTIPDGDIITTSPIARPDQANESKIVTTISGSRYKLGTAGNIRNKDKNMSIQELQKRSRVIYDLNKEVVGDDARQYLLAGKATKSTSGKSTIYKAYRSDDDGLPSGEALTVKISTNWEAIQREADNYAKITKTGLIRGQFTELIDYLPIASVISKKFKSQSALVMERGVTDLKRYIAINGALTGAELRDAAASAAQCIQAVHASKLVWTDMKSENFVVTVDGKFKGIDLESAMPVQENPVDYSPEGTPPEFARAFLAGDGPYFILQYNYDIWSLGMIFYEMSVGRGYFDGKSPVQITKILRSGPEIDIRAVPDPTFRNLIGKCLQLDPRKRYNIIQVLLHPYFLSSGFGPLSFR
jgi:Protein kinase domain